VDHDQACAFIWRLWQLGDVAAALPADLAPRTRAEGYAIQACFERRSAKPRYGWKIAATSSAGQTHIGVDGPLAGRLLAERILPGGASVSLARNRMRVCEPEFAFRFARALAPRPEHYTQADVMAAVGDLHLTLELPDSRFCDFARAGGPALIAEDACADRLVVGPRVTADWRTLDLSRHVVKARVGDRYAREGIGSNVLGDPRAGLAWLVNEVTRLGITIQSGELVTTGTCMVPLEIAPGDCVEADYGILGRIGVRLTA